jgi:hypothetical protein
MTRPTTTDIQELKSLIASRLDVEEFLDILGWTLHDLVDVVEEQIAEKFDEFIEACE